MKIGSLMVRRLLAVVSLSLCFVFGAKGQNTDALGTYTPYSLYGIGQLSESGTAYNISMGGIGIGMRDNRFINYLNPAAVTARDTLSFMLDFGIVQKNMYNYDGKNRSAYNVFNMQNFAFTAPIYKSSAFVIGIAPFSDVGYKFLQTEESPEIVGELGDVKYQKYGTGSLYQLFFGAGVTFWDRLSVGAQMLYYFGYIDRHSDILFNSSVSNNTIYTGWKYKVNSFSGKFGLQYSQPFKNDTELIVGATYRLGNSLGGDVFRYAFSESQSSSVVDTALYQTKNDVKLQIADEFGVGISLRKKDKWAVGLDYIQQNWHNSVFQDYSDLINFTPATARYYKAGFEITPNRYDIRYYMKRVTYRAGAYFEQSYISLNGHQINSFGITIGATFPILRLYNGVTFAVNMGQRGTLKHNLARERYINFMINFNLHDIWFVKYRYD